jgi:uncharacterized protein (TIGR02284 family)
MKNNDVVSILNELIGTCRDGQEGFRMSAENIHNSEFRRLFNIFSQQRAQFVSELEAEVHRLGGERAKSNVAGWLERKWGTIKNAIAEGDEGGLIMECKQSEESAVNKYREALTKDLPLDVQYVVKRQYMDIKDSYDRIRILQRAA